MKKVIITFSIITMLVISFFFGRNYEYNRMRFSAMPEIIDNGIIISWYNGNSDFYN